MGIKFLMKLIKDNWPNAWKQIKVSSLNGKILAWDASIFIYQFLVSTIKISKDSK